MAKAKNGAKPKETKEVFETLTFSDPFNGLVTIESEDGKLFTITQHRKGNAVTATTIDEANNEAKKYVEDTQF
jgi:hypothetical protein